MNALQICDRMVTEVDFRHRTALLPGTASSVGTYVTISLHCGPPVRISSP